MNVFEKIIKGEIPCSKILENDRFLSFYDINPKAKVHALVIPKQSIQDFNGITPELMAQMTSFIFEVVEKLGIKEKGYKLLTNVGKNAGQEVMHLHFHILSEDMH
ncbi:histidine triad nucleotide-binding protein [Helicobacter pylori]|uniref:Histidine triad nucleotide-binding protein n=1 Tax=Helicobacter pylori TaxID=210 RepID=A0AB73SE90_HELPX|nr:histidine triad nucleotide-binding protein [Helicobacter pylori]MBH0283188.1 histidine triad nucleotide-binding protein [Helicobacter pylori]MBH0287553.1 histidine triad nucleotide-binding protein [Helicobacter pylori]MBH0290636.1 histidine triad nucleotide-binding protein [Helicobacter pylori]MBH0296536.1 histidine triad nucleotide-binding protein [Helicobacter pylori]NHB41190.1 histidine triad nucleotide-binding protein [Helicobacter pylori]